MKSINILLQSHIYNTYTLVQGYLECVVTMKYALQEKILNIKVIGCYEENISWRPWKLRELQFLRSTFFFNGKRYFSLQNSKKKKILCPKSFRTYFLNAFFTEKILEKVNPQKELIDHFCPSDYNYVRFLGNQCVQTDAQQGKTRNGVLKLVRLGLEHLSLIQF